MAMLPRLVPRNFYDLVIEISIVRPGDHRGMVHPYLRRRRGEEPVDYPHESLRPVLEKTLGIPLFQEQVMKLAVVAADYTRARPTSCGATWRPGATPGGSRSTTSGWSRGWSPRDRAGVRRAGLRADPRFGEYASREHAASFALISYAASYLKRHYPRSSPARCSTPSRWGSTRRRRSSRTHATTA